MDKSIVKRDVVVALVCVIASMALFFSLGTIDEPRAKIFPRIVIVVMGVLSMLLLTQTLLPKKRNPPATGGKPFPLGRLFILFALIVGYFAVMQTVGFYLSAFLFFVIVTTGFDYAQLTLTKIAVRILQSAVFMAVLFVLFNTFLEVQTPRGWLF